MPETNVSEVLGLLERQLPSYLERGELIVMRADGEQRCGQIREMAVNGTIRVGLHWAAVFRKGFWVRDDSEKEFIFRPERALSVDRRIVLAEEDGGQRALFLFLDDPQAVPIVEVTAPERRTRKDHMGV